MWCTKRVLLLHFTGIRWWWWWCVLKYQSTKFVTLKCLQLKKWLIWVARTGLVGPACNRGNIVSECLNVFGTAIKTRKKTRWLVTITSKILLNPSKLRYKYFSESSSQTKAINTISGSITILLALENRAEK